MSFIDQSLRTLLAASRREMAEYCSSISETRTPLRRLSTYRRNERESMRSSLSSSVSEPVTASWVSLLTRAKVTLSPGFLVRSSLTWMIEFCSEPISPAKRFWVRYSLKNLSSHCWTVSPVTTRVSAIGVCFLETPSAKNPPEAGCYRLKMSLSGVGPAHCGPLRTPTLRAPARFDGMTGA